MATLAKQITVTRAAQICMDELSAMEDRLLEISTSETLSIDFLKKKVKFIVGHLLTVKKYRDEQELEPELQAIYKKQFPEGATRNFKDEFVALENAVGGFFYFLATTEPAHFELIEGVFSIKNPDETDTPGRQAQVNGIISNLI